MYTKYTFFGGAYCFSFQSFDVFPWHSQRGHSGKVGLVVTIRACGTLMTQVFWLTLRRSAYIYSQRFRFRVVLADLRRTKMTFYGRIRDFGCQTHAVIVDNFEFVCRWYKFANFWFSYMALWLIVLCDSCCSVGMVRELSVRARPPYCSFVTIAPKIHVFAIYADARVPWFIVYTGHISR
jgi:hypothetical protein